MGINARKIKKNQKRFVDFLFTKKMIKNASGFHSVGDQETDVYLQLGAQKNNIYRIDHGINLDDFIIKTKTTIFEKLHIDPKSEQYIIFMSRIDKKKGLELLISSFNKINKKYPNLYLIIAGSGDENYKRELKKFVNDLQLNDKIKWAGLVSNEEKLELLKNALFFVLTSHSDVHPIAVQDALTMHIPVVITRACDYPEVETYNTGFLVDENIDEISDAFEQLLNDHKLRQTFSRLV
jgi:glycosyltransferase involved in cell wall biosynthesis